MKDRRDWMNSATDPILELLDENIVINIIGMVNTIEYRYEQRGKDLPKGVSDSNIRRQVPKLEKHGFIEQVGEEGTYHRITDKGRAYLRGEIVDD